MNINVKKLHEDAVIPTYAHASDAGFDLYAVEDTFIRPQSTKAVRTGLAFEIPPGYEVQIRPRSGLSANTHLRVANAPGTIDSEFRGEIKVILDNLSDNRGLIADYGALDTKGNLTKMSGKHPKGTYAVQHGDRIAQGVLKPVPRATFTEVAEIAETERTGGFGSTGK